ncbi:unnamed protein product [Ectocarpus sp. 6 AP-2014]
MSKYDSTLLTPATCVASDDDMTMSPAGGRHRGRWSGRFGKRSSHKDLLLTSKTPPPATTSSVTSDPAADIDKRRAKTPNIIKRAVHTINKKRRRSLPPSQSRPSSSRGAAVSEEPPKIDELGIDPRLLEKWKARKELKKQGAVAGGRPVSASRGTATLVMVGLSSGSLVWTKERIRTWSQAHGVLLALCVLIAAVAIACTLILSRCS